MLLKYNAPAAGAMLLLPTADDNERKMRALACLVYWKHLQQWKAKQLLKTPHKISKNKTPSLSNGQQT
jgi:hypothetical protein